MARIAGLGWIGTHEDITDQVDARQLAAAREAVLAQQNMRFHAAGDQIVIDAIGTRRAVYER